MINISDETIKEIAEELETGFKVYYNLKTGRIISIPEADGYSNYEENPWQQVYDEIDENMGDMKYIPKMDSRSGFNVMENFTETVDNEKLQEKLYTALSKSKPFKRFKVVLYNHDKELKLWYAFQLESYKEWVKEQISPRDYYLEDME